MKNKKVKKSKKIYFSLICLAISVLLIFSSTARFYAYLLLLGYPAAIANYSVAKYHQITVEQEFRKIPDVEVIDMNLDYDENEVHPLVKVKNKGFLLFINLHKESFYNPPHLLVKSFGDVIPSSRCYQDNKYWSSWWLDFGFQGDEAALFPFKIRNVRDVVDHYDDITAILQTWPNNHSDPRAPRLEKKTKDGQPIECFYVVEKAT